jgi:predicted alpha/beta superfamily hydrolase
LVNRSIYILIFLCFFGFAQARAATQIITLKSKVFDNERSLRILLPEGYDREREEPYPVLYMNDGQNLYSAEDSMTGQEWQMDEILPSLIKNGNLEPIIVVGIDTLSYADRANEYLPWPDEYLTPYIEEPMGSSYPDFLEQEVLPLIEQKYNVGKTPRYRTLGGSSYGGLITLYTAVSSELFSKYLIESPSL